MVVVVFVADQTTKQWCVRAMEPGESIRIMGDVVRITSVRNTGAAFGLLPGNARRLVLASLVALGVVAYAFFALPPGRMRERVALALIGGGAVGNLADRIRLGEVIDFLDVGLGERHRWPTFNVADSAVSVGVMLLLLFAALHRREERREAEARARAAAAAGMPENSESA
jgi:signal peptidase II